MNEKYTTINSQQNDPQKQLIHNLKAVAVEPDYIQGPNPDGPALIFIRISQCLKLSESL